MEQTWIVLLEAMGDAAGPAIRPEGLRALIEAMACDDIVGLHDPYRYGVQVEIVATTPAGALFRAIACWEEAVHRLGLERWELQRAEVVTRDEFARECVGADPRVDDAEDEGRALLRSAFCDSLTGLPGWALFSDLARRAIAAGGAGDQPALVVVAVDGQECGDEVLQALAMSLTKLPAAATGVARLDGNEFVLLVAEAERSAESLAGEILDVTRRLALKASVAIVAVAASDDLGPYLRRALAAVGVARKAGGDCYQRWEPGLIADR